ncbi:hypothetical protein Taro_029405, partial [Colocasia esculenta]|nr:hypothetical protein [Colocasia esculenta]
YPTHKPENIRKRNTRLRWFLLECDGLGPRSRSGSTFRLSLRQAKGRSFSLSDPPESPAAARSTLRSLVLTPLLGQGRDSNEGYFLIYTIQLTILLSANMNDEVQLHSLFPLYILLARPVADTAAGEHSAVYRLSRVCILPTFSELGRRDQAEASFIIPEVRRLLTDVRSRNLTVILLSHAKLEGSCIWGKLPLESLLSTPEKYETLRLGQRVEMLSTVDLHSSVLEPTFLDINGCLTFQVPQNFGATSNGVGLSRAAPKGRREVELAAPTPRSTCKTTESPRWGNTPTLKLEVESNGRTAVGFM